MSFLCCWALILPLGSTYSWCILRIKVEILFFEDESVLNVVQSLSRVRFFCFHYETAKPILNLVSSVCTETARTGGPTPIDHLCS